MIRQIYTKYINVNLMLRIAIGLLIGSVLGLTINMTNTQSLAPSLYETFETIFTILGNLFIGALRSIAPVLIFFIITHSLMRRPKKKTKTLQRQMILYVVGTFFAALIAVIVNIICEVKLTMPGDLDTNTPIGPANLSQVLITIFESVVSNPFNAIANANFLGVLFWAIMFGIAARQFASKGFINAFETITNIFTKIIKVIIEFAPFGICGLVYTSIIYTGAQIFTEYGFLLLVYLGCTLSMFFIFNAIIVFVVLKRNPYPLIWKTIKESAFTAFFFRSSAANIPVNMQLCKKLGLDEENYSISIPIGSTINMEGAAITIITLTLVACGSLNIQIDFGPALILSIIATVSAIGASGVSGGSILLVPMALSLFGINGEMASAVVAVGFIIGVIQDSVETALNSSTDVLFTATIQFYEKIKKGAPVHKVVGGTLDDVK